MSQPVATAPRTDSLTIGHCHPLAIIELRLRKNVIREQY